MDKYYTIVPVKNKNVGRCIDCDKKHMKCTIYTCKCKIYEQYKYDIKRERFEKLKKLRTT